MKQQKIILIGMGALAFLLVVGGGWRLVRSMSAAATELAARDATWAELQKLFNSNPFPSATNILVLQTDVRNLHEQEQAMIAGLRTGQIESEEPSPAVFIRRLEENVRDLQRQAPIVEGARVVPDGFAFGFGRYLATGGGMPSPVDVPRLTQQLKTIELLAGLVYESRMREWRGVRREEFEAGPAAETPTSRRRPARPSRTVGAAAAPMGGGLYTVQHYTLELTGRKLPLLDLINRLAASPTCMVVTEVDVRKRGTDVRSLESAPAADPAAAPRPAVVPLHAERLVSGPDVDPLLDARIEIDVIHFEGE